MLAALLFPGLGALRSPPVRKIVDHCRDGIEYSKQQKNGWYSRKIHSVFVVSGHSFHQQLSLRDFFTDRFFVSGALTGTKLCHFLLQLGYVICGHVSLHRHGRHRHYFLTTNRRHSIWGHGVVVVLRGSIEALWKQKWKIQIQSPCTRFNISNKITLYRRIIPLLIQPV